MKIGKLIKVIRLENLIFKNHEFVIVINIKAIMLEVKISLNFRLIDFIRNKNKPKPKNALIVLDLSPVSNIANKNKTIRI